MVFNLFFYDFDGIEKLRFEITADTEEEAIEKAEKFLSRMTEKKLDTYERIILIQKFNSRVFKIIKNFS